MAVGIKLMVWGDLASFTRPEMKVERVSYPVLTPSAARGILEAVYWKPEIRWVIDRIHVLKPIRFTHVRRNEISAKIPLKGAGGVEAAMKTGRGSLGIAVEDWRQQRAGMLLRDVRYGIEAHFELRETGASAISENSAAKHLEMFRRRASRGQCFHHPYLGTREFPASFEMVEQFPRCPPEIEGEFDLGHLLLDLDYVPDVKGRVVDGHTGTRQTVQPRFFAAVMRDGVIDIPALSTGEVRT